MEGHSDECLVGQENMDIPIESAEMPHFSEEEAQVLAGKLANKESYREAHKILAYWLERGECKESNKATFSSLLSLCSNNSKKLKMEQKENAEKVENVEKKLLDQSCVIDKELKEIELVFEKIEKQGILDSFSESQRNGIQMMKQDVLVFKNENSQHLIKKELSDCENEDNIRLHLEEQVNTLNSKVEASNKRLEDLLKVQEEYKEQILRLKLQLEEGKNEETSSECIEHREMGPRDGLLLGLTSSLLAHRYPLAVGLAEIHACCNDYLPAIEEEEVENFMRRCTAIFEEIDSEQGSKWVYIGFNTRGN